MKKIQTTFLFAVLLLATNARAQVPAPAGGANPPAQAAGALPATPTDYIIGPQDVLRVTVFDEPTMSGSFRVDDDGYFQYPMLGRVQAAGLRPRDVGDTIKKRLEDGYINRAEVAVEVEQYRARSIFVVGEVRQPGKYPLTGAMTLIEALAAAGSTTGNASSQVLILRPRTATTGRPVTPDQTDQATVTRVSLSDLQLGRLSQNVPLTEGDTVFVPKAEKFFVTGQIRNPGAFPYESGLTVLQAISLAGGLTDKGSNRRLKVIRIIKGKKTDLNVELDDLVQPGDTLVISQRLL